MTCGIYMIQNKVNNKIYIGQAVDIEERWKYHKCALRGNHHRNKHLQNSWNNYKEGNFEFTIICECDENQLNTMEEYYIFELMSYDDEVGYNNDYGGKSGRPTEEAKKKMSEAHKGENNPNYGKPRSEETKKKISESHKGETPSEETRKKIRETLRGRTPSEETRKKISEANMGRIHSEETRKKIGEALRGKTKSEEARQKMSESQKGNTNGSIPVVQLTLEGELVAVYGSSKEAGRRGFNNSSVSTCCRSERETHRGYVWMYLHEYKTLSEETIKKMCETKGKTSKDKNNTRPIPVVQLTLEGELVKVYDSSMEAEREGFGHQTIGSCCRGKRKTHRGYKWMYLSDYEAMKKEG